MVFVVLLMNFIYFFVYISIFIAYFYFFCGASSVVSSVRVASSSPHGAESEKLCGLVLLDATRTLLTTLLAHKLVLLIWT